MSIVWPVPFTIVSSTLGDGVDNLLTPNPREAFRGTGPSHFGLLVDCGTATAIDTFFLGFTTASAGYPLEVYSGNDPYVLVGTTTFAHSYRQAPQYHALLSLAAPVVARYFLFNMPGAGGLVAGVAALGLSIRPAGHEYGSGRPIADTSRVERLFDGGFGIDRGATSGGWQWTMPLTDDERDRLYAMALDAGIGSTILVAEHADGGTGANEAMHWGLLTKLEPYARQAPGENTWTMQVQDWA